MPRFEWVALKYHFYIYILALVTAVCCEFVFCYENNVIIVFTSGLNVHYYSNNNKRNIINNSEFI